MDIIFDIDGTLIDVNHRRKFVDGSMGKKDWKGFNDAMKDDAKQEQVWFLAQTLIDAGHRIIIMTGRSMDQQAISKIQLADLQYDFMLMRPNDEFCPDEQLKSDMLDHVRGLGYDPKIVFDDRDAVVDMWRQRGLLCCQVQRGDF